MSGFAMVPRWLADKRIDGKKLSGNGLMAYVQLALRGTWNPGTGEYEECRPCMKTLAYDMDVSVNTARTSVKEVVKFGGAIGAERFDERGNQLPTVYRVIFGAVVEPSSQTPPPESDRGGPPKNDRGVPQKVTGAPLQKVTDNQEPIHQEPNTKANLLVADETTAPAAAELVKVSGELAPAVSSCRSDVEALCERLASRIVENGCKPPTIDKGWRTAARLLLDKDGREFDKALALIDWCQTDEFWRANVRSMPTFRKQYDALRLKALAEWEKSRRVPAARGGLVEAHGMKLTPKNAAMFDLIEELRAEEAHGELAAIPDAPTPDWLRELEGAR